MNNTLTSQIREICLRHPGRTAIVDCEGSMSYAELEHNSNVLAHKIYDITGGANEFVVLILPRRAGFVAAALGVQKAGCAYVPVSENYPVERINYIIKDCRAKAVITLREYFSGRQTEEVIETLDAKILFLDDMDSTEGEYMDCCKPDARAVMLYTSGSTGTPKGVLHSARGLLHLSYTECVVSEMDAPWYATALIADFAFIVHATMIYPPLYRGGHVHIIDNRTRMDAEKLYEYLKAHDIYYMFVPSRLGVMMLNNYDVPVKKILLGGERVAGIEEGRLRPEVEVYNGYGMSESLAFLPYRITDPRQIYISNPQEGATCYLVDEDMQQVPDGETGELCICSDDLLCMGYYNNPQLNAEKFVACPFAPGKRMFRTGDRLRRTAQGYQYCGRMDNMVKLRGQRVETGEIDNVALEFPDIEVAVCAMQTINDEDYLCLYYQSRCDVDEEALRVHLSKKLAAYMLPTFYMRLEAMPLNPRGKIDRKALPIPEYKPVEIIAPESETEQRLYDIAAEMLQHKDFGVTTDLFLVGMTSLKAMKMVSEANQSGIDIRTTDLMLHRSIRKVLTAERKMCYWYNNETLDKPILIFVQGIMLTNDILPKLDALSEKFSILVIEPVHENYENCFKGKNIDYVIDSYKELLNANLPENPNVFGFLGLSFGGVLAYRLAAAIKADWVENTILYMGDPILVSDPDLVKAAKENKVKEYLQKRNLPEDAFDDQFISRMSITNAIMENSSELPLFEGNAKMFSTTGPGALKSRPIWKQHDPKIEVIEVNCGHNQLCCQIEYTHLYTDLLFSDLKEYNKEEGTDITLT